MNVQERDLAEALIAVHERRELARKQIDRMMRGNECLMPMFGIRVTTSLTEDGYWLDGWLTKSDDV